MYLKDKLIKNLKIKNVILAIIGIFNVLLSVEVMVSLSEREVILPAFVLTAAVRICLQRF